MAETKSYMYEEWLAEGEALFGPDKMKWKFVCPSCGHIATVKDWRDAGAPTGAVAFSCVGRFTGSKRQLGDKTGGPCNYTGGGLFKLNPIEVVGSEDEIYTVFDFAREAR